MRIPNGLLATLSLLFVPHFALAQEHLSELSDDLCGSGAIVRLSNPLWQEFLELTPKQQAKLKEFKSSFSVLKRLDNGRRRFKSKTEIQEEMEEFLDHLLLTEQFETFTSCLCQARHQADRLAIFQDAHLLEFIGLSQEDMERLAIGRRLATIREFDAAKKVRAEHFNLHDLLSDEQAALLEDCIGSTDLTRFSIVTSLPDKPLPVINSAFNYEILCGLVFSKSKILKLDLAPRVKMKFQKLFHDDDQLRTPGSIQRQVQAVLPRQDLQTLYCTHLRMISTRSLASLFSIRELQSYIGATNEEWKKVREAAQRTDNKVLEVRNDLQAQTYTKLMDSLESSKKAEFKRWVGRELRPLKELPLDIIKQTGRHLPPGL
ncbi:MAG: hypothetical protein Aurels2KO_23030 [Aureliella sp.]